MDSPDLLATTLPLRLYYTMPSQASTVLHIVDTVTLSPDLLYSTEVHRLIALKTHWLGSSTSISTSLRFFERGLQDYKKEETSKKKRRLSAKKRKCRRRLVFAIITDIELVAIYTCRRRLCFSFSDPFLPVSIFTNVDKAEELDGGGDNKTVVWLEDVGALMVTKLRWRRKKIIMTFRLS
ncbi:hypothetical protein YC2023_033444 [Brassica napus]